MPEVAEAPATTSAPANPAPVAEPNSSPSVGMLDHMAIDKPKPESKPETTSEAKPDSGKTTDAAPAPETKPAKLFAGRFKTPEELEKGYQESSSEGLRLYQESKALSTKIAERDAKIAELEDQIKISLEQAPFKELSKDELKELAEKDPVAASEYVAEKKLRDRDLVQARQKLKEQRENQERNISETRQFIVDRGQHMASNPEKFPDFESLIPNMEALRNKLGDDVKDKKWAPDVLYLVSLGQRYLQSLQKGNVSTAEADKKASAEATAVATTSGPGAQSPSEAPGGKEDPNSDKAIKARILKAAPSSLFNF